MVLDTEVFSHPILLLTYSLGGSLVCLTDSPTHRLLVASGDHRLILPLLRSLSGAGRTFSRITESPNHRIILLRSNRASAYVPRLRAYGVTRRRTCRLILPLCKTWRFSEELPADLPHHHIADSLILWPLTVNNTSYDFIGGIRNNVRRIVVCVIILFLIYSLKQ